METPTVTAPASERDTPAHISASLESFVLEHYDRLVRLARLVCRDPNEAGDAVQAALERAWKQQRSLRDPGALRSWLDRIVVREAIRLDRRRRSPFARFFDRPRKIAVEVPDPKAMPGASSADLQNAFEALPADQRVAIVLHLHYGYSVTETADIVGAPVETVRSRLRLGRQRLREALGDSRP